MLLFTFCHLVFMVAPSLQAYSSCYYPDGTYQPFDRPCIGNGAQESFCCGQNVTCLSDKVCYDSRLSFPNPYLYVRGSCTDQSFRSSACPNFCLTNSSTVGVMFQCGYQTDSYCCSNDTSPCACETGNITLAASLSDVSSIAFLGPEVSTTAYETQVVPSSATSKIGTFSGRTTTSAAIPPDKSSSSALPSAPVGSSAATTPAISTRPSENIISTDPPFSSHSNAKEGAALGVPIAILSVAIIVLVSALIRHKHRTKSTIASPLHQTLNRSSNAETHWELPPDTAVMEMESRMEGPELAA